MNNCPLCLSEDTEHYFTDKRRCYQQCNVCNLVFVPESDQLSSKEERAIYDLHQNALEDDGYRRFLSRVTEPLNSLLKEGAQGMDFGCGPGPLLALMLEEMGYKIKKYDPFYYPEKDVLNQCYDFVTTTEVVEHFNHPKNGFDVLVSLLKKSSLLAVMTKRVISKEAFSKWHYKNDQTHVSFYSDATFEWIAETYGLKEVYKSSDVVIFVKQ